MGIRALCVASVLLAVLSAGCGGGGGNDGGSGGGSAGTGGTGGTAGTGGTGGTGGTAGEGGTGGTGGTEDLCGNGTRDPGEECDDGNRVPDDGCSATCEKEIVCGDGVVEGTEACDGADLDGQGCRDFGFNSGSLACDDSCAVDTSGCFNVELCGNGRDDDGDGQADCDDDDCFGDVVACPRCGDGVVNNTEDCDGSVAVDCTDLGFQSGVVTCSDSCTLDTNACVPNEDCAAPGDEDHDGLENCADPDCALAFECPACGNGVAQQGEDCDGAAFAVTCANFGFNAGTLSCGNSCLADISDCHNVELCGTPGDEDGDGALDCDDSDCLNVAPCPVCGNGIVEGNEECDDHNTAEGDGCTSTCTIEINALAAPGSSISVTGTIDGTEPLWARPTATCGARTDQQFYDVHYIENTSNLPYTITLTASWAGGDGFLYVYNMPFNATQQTANCVIGNDDYNGRSGSRIVNVTVPAHTLMAVVATSYYPYTNTGTNTGIIGNYSIEIATGAACGDGVASAPEACDDGNAATGDGCTPACTVEPGWVCDAQGCRLAVCGNGVLEAQEACDDGNTVGGDGCTASCTAEGDSCAEAYPLNIGWDASTGAWLWAGDTESFSPNYTGSCAPTVSRDGVASFTAPTAGRYVVGVIGSWDPVLYVWNGTCGQGPELVCADDGSWGESEAEIVTLTANQTIYLVVDGSSTADDEYGSFTMVAAKIVCGDGQQIGDEQCDDGNTVSGDGCSATCTFEGTVETEPNDDLTTADPLAIGTVGRGSLEWGWFDLDFDIWSFQATAGLTYEIHTATAMNGSCGTNWYEDTWIAVADGTETILLENSDISTSNYCSSITWTAPATGTYYIGVSSDEYDEIPLYYLFLNQI